MAAVRCGDVPVQFVERQQRKTKTLNLSNHRFTLLFITFALCLVAGGSSSTAPRRRLVKHFINLTNGLEVLPELLATGISMNDINYCRIQSTHAENTNYYGIIESLDTSLLMHLALGNVCLLYDYGSRGTGQLIGAADHRFGIPRSYWWGCEWIRHVLAHYWHLPESLQAKRNVRGYNSKRTFDEQIAQMPAPLQRRLKFYRPYLSTQTLHLYPLYSKTVHDGEKDFYFDLVKTLQSSEPSAGVFLAEVDVEAHVLAHHVPQSMHLYKTSDFDDLGNNKKSLPS